MMGEEASEEGVRVSGRKKTRLTRRWRGQKSRMWKEIDEKNRQNTTVLGNGTPKFFLSIRDFLRELQLEKEDNKYRFCTYVLQP
jgi:hypothetical protein